MNVAPLAIIQGRYASTRLPGKALIELDGKPQIRRVWEQTIEAVGAANTVIAMTATPENNVLLEYCTKIGALTYSWEGPDEDVLGRFYHCAHHHRWHPETIILRVTPDDPYKSADAMVKTVLGYRLPVEIGGEAFTLEQLDAAHHDNGWSFDELVNWLEECIDDDDDPDQVAHIRKMLSRREHLTHALFDTPPPPAPPGQVWSIDTPEDLESVRAQMRGPKIVTH